MFTDTNVRSTYVFIILTSVSIFENGGDFCEEVKAVYIYKPMFSDVFISVPKYM